MTSALRWLVSVLLALTFAAGAATAGDEETSAAVQALQNRILADPELAGQVHSLSDDPQMREVLADPDVADAVNRGDFAALLANPKVRALADNPNMQNLTREIMPAR